MTDVIFISVTVLLCKYGQQFFYLFYTKLYFTGKMSIFTATFRKMSIGPYSVYSFLHTNICYTNKI